MASTLQLITLGLAWAAWLSFCAWLGWKHGAQDGWPKGGQQ